MNQPKIFNTDQGSQFTSEAFTSVLKTWEVKICMDGKQHLHRKTLADVEIRASTSDGMSPVMNSSKMWLAGLTTTTRNGAILRLTKARLMRAYLQELEKVRAAA